MDSNMPQLVGLAHLLTDTAMTYREAESVETSTPLNRFLRIRLAISRAFIKAGRALTAEPQDSLRHKSA